MTDARAVRWQVPDLGPAPKVPNAPPAPNVEQLAAIEKAAREEGYALGHKQGYATGHAEGYARGQDEVTRLIAQLGGVLNGFARPLAELDHEVEQALGALAVRIAGALLGRACHAEPELLAALVRAALAQIGTAERDAEVHLHPDDVALLQQQLGDGLVARLVPDPTLKRGETRVHTPLLRLDGTFDARLAAALAALQTDGEAP